MRNSLSLKRSAFIYFCVAAFLFLLFSGIFKLILNVEEKFSMAARQKENMKQDILAVVSSSLTEEEVLQVVADHFVVDFGLIGGAVLQSNPPQYVLLETMGQLMEYAALVGCETLFSKAWGITQKHMLSAEGYFYWRREAENPYHPDECTALVDVFRLFRALITAGGVFGDLSYEKDAVKVAESICTFNQEGGLFSDSFDGSLNLSDQRLSLFYIDYTALTHMAKLLPEAVPVCRKTIEVLMQAPVNEYGFFPLYYDIGKKQYQFSSEVNMIECLYTACMALESGKDIGALLDFLKQELELRGKIFNYYNYTDALPLTGDESTALYALVARLFAKADDPEAARKSLQLMLNFRIREQESLLCGGFGDFDSSGSTLYAFDQFEALQTISFLGRNQF